MSKTAAEAEEEDCTYWDQLRIQREILHIENQGPQIIFIIQAGEHTTQQAGIILRDTD